MGAGNKESAGELGGGSGTGSLLLSSAQLGCIWASLRADVVVTGSIYNWGYELSGGDTYPSGGKN